MSFGKLFFLHQGQTAVNIGKFLIYISSSSSLVPIWFTEQVKKKNGIKKEHSPSFWLTYFVISDLCSLFSSSESTFKDQTVHINLWFSECSPWVSSVCITWELVKIDIWLVPSQLTESEVLGMEPSSLPNKALQVALVCSKV